MDHQGHGRSEHSHDGPRAHDARRRGRGRAGGRDGESPFGRRARRGPNRGGSMHRAARGNVRAAILALLAEQKASGGPAIHGYQIIQELSTRTGGAWRPSPGSIYPTLQLLEDEGLIASQAPEGKRLFELTDAGQAEFDRTKGTKAPWEQVSDGFGESRIQLKVAARDTLIQLVWVARNGTDEQRAEVLTLLGEFQERLSALVPEAAAELAHDHGHGRGHVRRAARPGGRAADGEGFGPPETDDFEV